MNQQINLYLDEFRQRRDPLDAKHLGLGLLALIAVLVAVTAGLSWQVRATEARVAELRAEHGSAQSAMTEQQQRLQALRAEQDDDSRLRRLRAELAAKRRLVEFLESGRFGTRGGFSGYLGDLARTRVEGLWLERLEFQAGGRNLRVAGHALEPESVPEFLGGLGRREAFSGHSFRTVRIDRTEDGDRLDFLLASERTGGEE